MLSHDAMAEKVSEAIREKITSETSWQQVFAKTDLADQRVYATWPRPDFVHNDRAKKIKCAYEFKPHQASKQELIRGLGQAVSYRVYFDYSALVIPKTSELQIFSWSIKRNKLNVGLITYPQSDVVEDVTEGLELVLKIKKENKRTLQRIPTEPFWAYYRDMSMGEILLMLRYAREARKAADEEQPDVKNTAFQRTFDDIVQGQTRTLTGRERHVSDTEKTRRNYKKNYTAFLNHLSLWDYDGDLTAEGRTLLQIGEAHGTDSSRFRDTLGGLVLIHGKHLRLIEVFKDRQMKMVEEEETFDRKRYTKEIEGALQEKGFVTRNPKRGAAAVPRLPLQDELNLWSTLGFVKAAGNRYFKADIGIEFDDDRILRLITPFLPRGSARR